MSALFQFASMVDGMVQKPSLDATHGIFSSDNRLGVPGTLHRISAMQDRQGGIYGLTYRVGWYVPGAALLLADVLSAMKASLDPHSGADRPQSLLLLGPPGVGKMTLLQDIAFLLSSPPEQGGLGLAVVIVDTSNEIAGDSDECHPCIGHARRMMVPSRDQQAQVLVEAVQNHNPQVIIVDEIGTKQEVAAARTIAQRGVLLVGTAHGNNLNTLLRDPELRPLVGGVEAVTLGDHEANISNAGHRWQVHFDVGECVDIMLQSQSLSAASSSQLLRRLDSAAVWKQQLQQQQQPNTHLHSRGASGKLVVEFETPGAARQALRAASTVASLAAAADVMPSAPNADGAASGFAGAWLVDLLHVAVHRAIQQQTTAIKGSR